MKPLSKRVVVRRASAESVTPAGIIIPESSKRAPDRGIVVAVADDCATGIKPGDKVMFENTYMSSPATFNQDGEEYMVFLEKDIIAIL